MKFDLDGPHDREILARRLGLSPNANIESLTEALLAAEADETLFRSDADNRPVGDEYDDHFGEPRHHRLAAGARARRGVESAIRPGGPAPRPQGRVVFGGNGASFLGDDHKPGEGRLRHDR
jgi:hypothetical protein